MQCNIDARGKSVRLVCGILLLIVGLILLFSMAIPHGGVVEWIVTLFPLLTGAFAVFEGWAGWCVLRAMGFKTSV